MWDQTTTLPAAATGTASGNVEQGPASVGCHTDEHAVDQTELLERFEGETDLLREVIDIFLGECPARLARLRAAVRHRDAAALALAAHSLTGCLGTFAAPRAVQLSREIERCAQCGDFATAEAPCVAIEGEMGRVGRELVAIRDACTPAPD